MAAQTISRSETEHTDEEREEYLRLVEYNFYPKKIIMHHPCTRSEINAMIARVKANVHDPSAKNRYDVIKKNGEDILVINKTGQEPYVVQILAAEDCFDVIMDIHKKYGKHINTVEISKILKNTYMCPPLCLSLVLQVCRQCNHLKPNQHTQLYVTDMFHETNTLDSCCLFIYIDKATNFTLLRPVMKKSDLEVALELYKIFTEFGPPKVLEINSYNDKMCCNVDKLLTEIYPEFNVHIEIKPHTHASTSQIPILVKEALINWMEETKNNSWEVGCYILQREMNTCPNSKQRHTNTCIAPQKLYFENRDTNLRPENVHLSQDNAKVEELKHMDDSECIFVDDMNTKTSNPETQSLHQEGDQNVETAKTISPETIYLDDDSSDASTSQPEPEPEVIFLVQETLDIDNIENKKLNSTTDSHQHDAFISEEEPIISIPKSVFLVKDKYGAHDSENKTFTPETINLDQSRDGKDSGPNKLISERKDVYQENSNINKEFNISEKPEDRDVIDKSKESSLDTVTIEDDDDVDFGADLII